MTISQCDQAIPPAGEERISLNDQGIRAALGHRREGGIDIAVIAGPEDPHLHPELKRPFAGLATGRRHRESLD